MVNKTMKSVWWRMTFDIAGVIDIVCISKCHDSHTFTLLCVFYMLVHVEYTIFIQNE